MTESQGTQLLQYAQQSNQYAQEVSAKLEGIGILAGKCFFLLCFILACCAVSVYLGKR